MDSEQIADIKWTSQIPVALPQEQAFNYIADFSAIRLWDPSVVNSTLQKTGQEQTIGKGSQFEITFDSVLNKSMMKYEILNSVPPHELHLKGHHKNFTTFEIIRITQDNNNKHAATIHYCLEINVKNSYRFLLPLLKPMTRRMANKAARNLQRLGLPDTTRPRKSNRLLAYTLFPFFWHCTKLGFRRLKDAHPLPVTSDKRVVITGCTSGIGREIAFELARTGCEIIMINRNHNKAVQFKKELESRFNIDVTSYIADLSNATETQQVAYNIKNAFNSIDVLINNAGSLIHEHQIKEGFEFHCAIHLVAPFILSTTLLPLLKNRQCKGPGRVINMCSGGLYGQSLPLHDLQYEQGQFSGTKAYARAKRGLLDITQEMARLYDREEVVFNAMHPGWVATGAVASALPTFNTWLKPFLRNAYQGADTALWLALSYIAGHHTGLFWLDRKIEPHEILLNTATPPNKQALLFATLEGLLPEYSPSETELNTTRAFKHG